MSCIVRNLKPSLALALLASCITFSTACQADLRSSSLVENGIAEDTASHGRLVLQQLAEAHGLASWQARENARVVYSDTWMGWLNQQVAMPWPENGQRFEHTILLGTDNSRMVFLGGDYDQKSWGIQHWKTYTVNPGGEPRFEDDDGIKFWLPTNAYFIEAPFRLGEATVVAYDGTATLDGTLHDIVFLSWSQAAPQGDIDQYIAYIDRDTGRLSYLTYTVRDMAGFLVGTMKYDDYRQVDGVWIAHSMHVHDEPGGEPELHGYQIESVSFDVDVPERFVVPRPELRGQK